jgi:hypothetical protein
MKPVHYWVLVGLYVVIALLLNSHVLVLPGVWGIEGYGELSPVYRIVLGCFNAVVGWVVFAFELVLARSGRIALGRLCVWGCFLTLSLFFPSLLICTVLVDSGVNVGDFFPLLSWGLALGVLAAALSVFAAHTDLKYARLVPGVLALLHSIATTSFLAYYIGDLGTWPW